MVGKEGISEPICSQSVGNLLELQPPRRGGATAVISTVASHALTSVTSRHYAFHDFAEEKRSGR